jgi:hypothetical protein
MTPYVKLVDQTVTHDTSTRGVWRMLNRTSVRIISGNGKIIGTVNGGERIAVSGHEYFAAFKHKTDSSKDYVKRYSQYPTDAVPENYTRTVAIWYHIVAPSGLSGWVPGYSCSNVYHSEDMTFQSTIGLYWMTRTILWKGMRIIIKSMFICPASW